MDTETNQAHHLNPSLHPKEESLEKSPVLIASGGGSSAGGDRLKRDEWSEGAVSTLLEAYEAKWVLRNRAKLKGHDWEEVARLVSSRANCTKSPKTQTQCKNKIESMKKRYRSESASPDPSSWPLYPRLDSLLRGANSTLRPPPVPQPPITCTPAVLLEAPPLPAPPPPLALHSGPPRGTAQKSHGSDGVDRMATKVSILCNKISDSCQKD